MTDPRVPVREFGSVDAEVDGQRVVLSPRDFSYLGLEGSGAMVWDLIDGTRSIEQIVSELERRCEAPEGAIRADTLAFLEKLINVGLIADW